MLRVERTLVFPASHAYTMCFFLYVCARLLAHHSLIYHSVLFFTLTACATCQTCVCSCLAPARLEDLLLQCGRQELEHHPLEPHRLYTTPQRRVCVALVHHIHDGTDRRTRTKKASRPGRRDPVSLSGLWKLLEHDPPQLHSQSRTCPPQPPDLLPTCPSLVTTMAATRLLLLRQGPPRPRHRCLGSASLLVHARPGGGPCRPPSPGTHLPPPATPHDTP